jgi:hypothetical protein
MLSRPRNVSCGSGHAKKSGNAIKNVKVSPFTNFPEIGIFSKRAHNYNVRKDPKNVTLL